MFKNTVQAKQNMMAGYLHPHGPLVVKLWFEQIINLEGIMTKRHCLASSLIS